LPEKLVAGCGLTEGAVTFWKEDCYSGVGTELILSSLLDLRNLPMLNASYRIDLLFSVRQLLD